MSAALATGAVLTALLVPRLLRLDHAPPWAAAAVWFLVLVLRAAVSVAAAVFLVVVLPHLGPLDAITHWCLHTVLPGVAARLGADGHAMGDAAYLVPAALLLWSLVWAIYRTWRAGRVVAALIDRAVGPGPRGSLVVGDGAVFVAAAGLLHPRVVVSAGALTVFDDDELEASLAHERGHIRRHHRWIVLVAQGLRAVAAWMPGTRAAFRELTFHLERDADRFATRQHPPETLASAICKAALGGGPATPGLALAQIGVTRRLRQLLDDERRDARRRPPQTVLGGILALALCVVVALPAGTVAAANMADAAPGARHCQDG